MKRDLIQVHRPDGRGLTLPIYIVHNLVIGSGAAGLNAALQLHKRGLDDVLIITEGLEMGTSINTGSDKQTYYKLSLFGGDADSPLELAESLFAGGSMHGDIALVEAVLSARAFFHLVELGLSFPQDRYGEFVGYKTDHDPRRRATSVGPYTSREMCRALIAAVKQAGIPVHEGRVVVALLTVEDGGGNRRIAGAVAVNLDASPGGDPIEALEVYAAENVVFAVGGPGGLYKTSVYPSVHTGGIGLALLIGARAQNLCESQFGLSSIGFRWNVSGTYMQVIPRFISTEADGTTDPREFLRPYFSSAGEMNSMVFLKGYQWPFDARKVVGGSSLIDLLVYIETVIKKRRVFLDFRRDPEGFAFEDLSREALDYLTNSQALLPTPLARLARMNPAAIELYREHGIDLASVPLEIAVCAQHNNGGLAGNIWWESVNIRHLFPVGEVNGSHGVYRPGGAALNAGQVGGFRAAEYIKNRYADWTLDLRAFAASAKKELGDLLAWACRGEKQGFWSWREERSLLQARMSEAGAHVRRPERLMTAVAEAWEQWRRLAANSPAFGDTKDLAEAFTTRQLCFTHAVYLEAIAFAVRSGVGSRGSALVVDGRGTPVHPLLGDEWRFAPEDPSFRDKVLETEATPDGRVRNEWVARRPIPQSEGWFETAWAAYRNGEIYN
ncbi:MAG: FAD-binding protein [Bacillota bacterium]